MPYKLNPTQQSDLIREYLDGSLSGERMSEAERLIEHDADARTLSDEGDKLETFVSQLKEALAMPAFPSEKNDDASDEIRHAVAEQLQSSGNADETAAIQLSEPSVSDDVEKQSGPQHPLAFLSPPQSADEMGRLNGYRVLKLLGEGGMGLVFEAEDVRLERRVALKVMKPEIAARDQHRARFVREARTAAKVEHDHICPIYQVGEENGVPFIAMPFLKGEPLDVRLKRQKPLPIAEAIRIGRDVAEGLAAAHDAGLVHRDIKPGNVWLEAGRGSAASRVKILDFGLARLTVDDIHLTQSGAIMGTPAYMAPEQARGKQVDHRADLFSLGVILYEMTTGRRPFTGGDTMSILTSLAIDVPTAPNVINFAVPPALSDLIMQLLSKAPENRPADGREVSEALLTILMQTSQPIVESIPPSNTRSTNAAPLATAVDATAVDPWSAIDESDSSPPVAPVTRVAKPQAAVEAVSRDAKASRSGARTGSKIAIAVALLFLIGGGFAAYKLAFETKDGTLIVEVDGDADVRFKNGELQIFDADGKLKYTLKPGERSKTMPPGPYKVQVVSADGVKLSTDKFEMTKDGKVTLRVTADAVANKDNGNTNPKQKESSPPPPGSTRLLLSGNDTVSFPSLKYLPLKGELTVEGFITVREKHGGGHSQLIGEKLHQWVGITNGVWASYVFHKFIESGELMVPDRRVHLAIVRAAKESRFYVDGKLAKTHEGSGERALGGHEGEFGLFASGTRAEISEVRVSTTARYRDKDFTPAKRFEPDADTLALYHCDEGQGDVLKDSSGNNHHGKIVGAKWVKADGAFIPALTSSGAALRFDGPSHLVNLPAISLDKMESFTLEGFVQIDKGSHPSNVTVIAVDTRHSINIQKANFWGFHARDAKTSVVSKTPFERNRRVHLAGVWDRGKTRLFVDGILQEGQILGADYSVDTTLRALLNLGHFVGTIGEVRISKVARYEKDFTPAKRFEPDADTLALYHCDEGSGDVLTDSSGNGHHGKIVGAKWVNADGSPIMSEASVDYALHLSGKDVVEIPSLRFDGSHPLTVEAWFRPDNPLTKNVGIYQRIAGWDGNFILDLDSDILSSSSFDGTGKPHASRQKLGPDDFHRFHHIAGVWDGKALRIFVDGKGGLSKPLAALRDPSKIPGLPLDNFTIGGRRQLTNFFNGLMGEVRVSKIARYTADFTPAKHHKPDADTLALYHLDEGQGDVLKDSSGNGHHGKIVGAKWVKTDVEISSDKNALEFDGTSSYATVPTWNFKGNHSLTVEAWVIFKRPLQPYLHEHVVSDAEGSGLAITNIKTPDRSSLTWNVFFNDKYYAAESPKPIPRHCLVHLAGVYDLKGEMRFYVDGKLQERTSVKNVGAFKPSTVPFTLGANPNAGPFTDFFLGIFHQVRISKTVRYEEDFHPVRRFEADANTVILYHFDEGQGDVLKDSSGNGHHGKIVGAKWVKVDGTAIAPTLASGEIGLSFGPRERVSIGSLKLDSSLPFTVEGFVTLGPTKSGQTIFNSAWHVGAGVAGGHWHFTAWRRPIAPEEKQKNLDVFSRQAAVPGKRTHIAGVYTGSQLLLFIDGKLQATVATKGPLMGMNKSVFDLATADPAAQSDFILSECRFSKVARYDKDFTPAQRHEPDADTLALYHFDEGSGDVLKDSSGNGHHGKIVGAKWVKVDGTAIATFPPLDPAWLKAVAAMPADKQVEAVKAEMLKRNPGFDGKMTPTIDKDGVVTGLAFLTDNATDISPVRALTGLTTLGCFGTPGNGKLADLSPLKGMRITSLDCFFTRVADLSPVKDMKLTHLHCGTTQVTDLSPLRDMKIVTLMCNNTPVGDLSPLQGMKLTNLDCHDTKVADLSPLKDMPLSYLDCHHTLVADLLPLKGTTLTTLNVQGTKVVSLSPLVGMKLTSLAFNDTLVADMTPLKGMKLEMLDCGNTRVSELAVLEDMKLANLSFRVTRVTNLMPLKNMKLKYIDYRETPVTDLMPLKGMPFVEIYCDFDPTRDGDWLRSIKTLEKINGKPAAEFLKEIEGKKVSAFPPLDPAWLKQVAAMKAEQQVEAVRIELTKRNPGFDSETEFEAPGGVVTTLKFSVDKVTDISPVRALTGLRELKMEGSGPAGQKNGKLADLAPIKGMSLTRLECARTQIADLSPLKDMKLKHFAINDTKVSDLSPLKEMNLTSLHCSNTLVSELSPLKGMNMNYLQCVGTKVSDLSPLKDMKLGTLHCTFTQVIDLSPLLGMPLKQLTCDFKAERDTAVLRSIKTLETINNKPAAEFWKEVDAKKP